MQMIGIKELKNKLTYYLKMTRQGDNVIVTDRGTPVAILHSLDRIESNAGVDERLASMAKRGMIRLPLKPGKLPTFRSVDTKGKPASEIIIEDRR
jgi:prevent-host-death family protein